MYNEDTLNNIKRLDFEDFLWVLFAILAIANVYGDFNEKEYLITDENNYQNRSNVIFEITLIVTLFIYIYFFLRNYHFYKKASEEQKSLYVVKLVGSSFLIAGIVCLIYFQTKDSNFIGSPAL